MSKLITPTRAWFLAMVLAIAGMMTVGVNPLIPMAIGSFGAMSGRIWVQRSLVGLVDAEWTWVGEVVIAWIPFAIVAAVLPYVLEVTPTARWLICSWMAIGLVCGAYGVMMEPITTAASARAAGVFERRPMRINASHLATPVTTVDLEAELSTRRLRVVKAAKEVCDEKERRATR